MAEDNEFKDLTVPELRMVAKEFGVDLEDKTKKVDIIHALEADGVTFEVYKQLLTEHETEAPAVTDADDDLPPAPVVEDDDDQDSVVIKMVRKNWTYEIRGYRFSQQHPYALVKEDDADYLIEVDGGFRMASPKELREFYGA